LFTGDLSNLAFESEFIFGSSLLRRLGDNKKVSVIPGNHDVYTAGAKKDSRFERYLCEFYPDPDKATTPDVYPFVKKIDDIEIIGLSSSHKTPILMAYGWIDDAQLHRLEAIGAKDDGVFRLVLLHHHVTNKLNPLDIGRMLYGTGELLEVLKKIGVDLILHGHEHESVFFYLPFNDRFVPVICPGSSNRLVDDPNKVARYHIYTFEGTPSRLARLDVKVYQPESKLFKHTSSARL
jgi:3',5'-cyclic AMP phosphodiesterase CpdA